MTTIDIQWKEHSLLSDRESAEDIIEQLNEQFPGIAFRIEIYEGGAGCTSMRPCPTPRNTTSAAGCETMSCSIVTQMTMTTTAPSGASPPIISRQPRPRLLRKRCHTEIRLISRNQPREFHQFLARYAIKPKQGHLLARLYNADCVASATAPCATSC